MTDDRENSIGSEIDAAGGAPGDQPDDAPVTKMKLDISEAGPCLRELKVEVPAEETTGEMEEALEDVRSRAELPGFRKGKAPLHMIRARFEEEVREEVQERVISRVLGEILTQQEWRPIAAPRVGDVSYAEDGSLVFKAQVELRPEIPELKIKGLRGTKPRVDVESSEIETQVNRLRESQAEFIPVDRPAEVGDLLVVDYERVDTEDPKEKGRKVTNLQVELGAQGLLPDFDRGLRGAVKGSDRTIEIKYPDDFPENDLVGKEIKLAVQVKEVKEKKLPPLDDEMAKTLGKYETLAQLREALAKAIAEEKEKEAERQYDNSLMDALLNQTPFEVPQSLVEHVMKGIERDMAGPRRGPDAPAPDPKLKELFRMMAEREVKRMFVTREIAEREGLEVTDEEINGLMMQTAAAMSQQQGIDLESAKEQLEKDGVPQRIGDRLIEEKVIQLLRENAEVEEEKTSV